MQYIKFTYITDPVSSGPIYPRVDGLQFIWERSSKYPLSNGESPEFFGTCPDESNTGSPGVLGVFSQHDWELMHADEMRARNPVPASCTRRQGLRALISYGFMPSQIEALIAEIPDEVERELARVDYEAATWERADESLQAVWAQLGGTPEQLDDLFRLAATL